jgi:2-oxoisovalerate dehydrogenase E2 component (dihydrolipoyl transacylase)
MKYFSLPDLGEGLQEAEIAQWHVHIGETVKADQLLVSVETAKAIVDIPSPCDAVIKTLGAEVGEVVHVGEHLVEFEGAEVEDSGTVVGEMPTAEHVSEDDQFIVGPAHRNNTANQKRNTRRGHQSPKQQEPMDAPEQAIGYATKLKAVRRSMAKNMAKSASQCVPVTLFDEVDIHCWNKKQDTTMRLIMAMRDAAQAEPLMNAWFDKESLSIEMHEHIDLGIAVDTQDGLFVPVLRNIAARSAKDLKRGLEQLKTDVASRAIPPKELMGYTIMLSNFGTLAGKYGTPIIVPPCVCILGAGQIYSRVVEHKGKFKAHAHLPLSLTFDHQVTTGGEAARFLATALKSLSKKKLKKNKS